MPERDEERGLLAQPLGRQRLQALDGGIFLPHVVADLGAGHGLAHLGRRERHRVRRRSTMSCTALTSSCEDAGRARRPHSV